MISLLDFKRAGVCKPNSMQGNTVEIILMKNNTMMNDASTIGCCD